MAILGSRHAHSKVGNTHCLDTSSYADKATIESLGFFRSHHQVVPAGQTPIYSNVAFQLLAMAYDAITGESFDTAFNTALVKPLSLTRTFLRLPRNDTNALIVEPASDFFPGPWWDFDLGLKAPYVSHLFLPSHVGPAELTCRSDLVTPTLQPKTSRGSAARSSPLLSYPQQRRGAG